MLYRKLRKNENYYHSDIKTLGEKNMRDLAIQLENRPGALAKTGRALCSVSVEGSRPFCH